MILPRNICIMAFCSTVVLQRDSRTVTQQTLRQPNGSARMAFKSSSVINLVYGVRQTKHDANVTYYFSDPTNVGCFFAISLPPSADSAKINIISTNKTSWSNPRQTRTCYIFRLWVIIKALLKQISLYLLMHFRIRIIVVKCPDNKSARNHQPKSSVPEKSHKNHNHARPTLFQLKSSLPFSLFLFVWRLESTTTKSLTHRDNGGSGTGFWGTRRLAKPRRRVLKSPVPERPVVPVCKINGCKISRFALELFYILKKDADILLWAVEEED